MGFPSPGPSTVEVVMEVEEGADLYSPWSQGLDKIRLGGLIHLVQMMEFHLM